MKVIPLNCNHCGAPLEVSAKARFVTCGFCEKQLAIEHTGTGYSTALIEDIKDTTDKLVRDVEEIKSNVELERLDAGWHRTRQRHMVSDKEGRMSLPTKTGAVVGGGAVAVFGVIWMIFAGTITGGAVSMGAPFPIMVFPLFGIVFIFIGLANAAIAFNKADRYERDWNSYRRERSKLVSEINRRSE